MSLLLLDLDPHPPPLTFHSRIDSLRTIVGDDQRINEHENCQRYPTSAIISALLLLTKMKGCSSQNSGDIGAFHTTIDREIGQNAPHS